MTVGKLRWLVVGVLASASAGLLTVMSTLDAAFAFGDEGDIALIMGGTGAEGGSLPSGLPTDEFLTGVFSRYIDPAEPFFLNQPVFPGFSPVGLPTPEQNWRLQGLTACRSTSRSPWVSLI